MQTRACDKLLINSEKHSSNPIIFENEAALYGEVIKNAADAFLQLSDNQIEASAIPRVFDFEELGIVFHNGTKALGMVTEKAP